MCASKAPKPILGIQSWRPNAYAETVRGSKIVSSDWNDCLPVETLCKIFRASIDNAVFPVALRSPLVLCHVCRCWRRLALGCPSLWQTIHLPYWIGFSLRHATSLLDFWLPLSRDIPIHVTFQARLFGTYSTDIVNHFVLHSKRISVLHLSFPKSLADVLFRMEPGRIDLLEVLVVDVNHVYFDEAHWDYPIITFSIAPRLRDCSFISQAPIPSSLIVLPWAQLRSLKLEGVTFTRDGTHILSQCRNLEECILGVVRWTSNSEPCDETFELRRLLSLTVEFEACGPIHPFFRCIVSPLLLQFSLAIRFPSGKDYPWPQDALMKWIWRSGMKLDRLKISCVRVQTKDLVSLLYSLPYVRHLRISDSNAITTRFFRTLTISRTSGLGAVPLLETLEIGDFHGSFVDEDAVVSMIQSRWWPGGAVIGSVQVGGVSRLVRARLTINPTASVRNLRRRLRHCTMEGLDLLIQ